MSLPQAPTSGDEAEARPGRLLGWLWAGAGTVSTLLLLLAVAAVVADAWELGHLHDPARLEALSKQVFPHGAPPTPDGLRTRPAPGRQLWLVGGSSLGIPSREAVDRALGAALADVGCPAEVSNLSVYGGDLAHGVAVLHDALADPERATPDAVLVYAGHNAYRNAYLRVGGPLGEPLRHTLSLVFVVDLLRGRAWPCPRCSWVDAHAWHRAERVGPWMHALQRRGLVTLDEDHWDAAEQVVAGQFAARLDVLRALTDAVDAEVVLSVPIGNNDSVVYGSLPRIQARRAAVDDAQSLRDEQRARIALRDAELFSADIRAKRPVRDHIRGLASAPRVWVHDTEAAFLDAGIPMGDGVFSDRFHFRPRGHADHFAMLAAFLADTPLCASPVSPPTTSPPR